MEMFELKNNKSDLNTPKSKLSVYFKYWYLFLIMLLLSIAAAVFYIKYKTVPEYLVNSTILIKDKAKGSGTSAAETFAELGLVKPNLNIDDEIGVFKSTSIMQIVLSELGMKTGYFIEGDFKDEELYKENIPFNVEVDSSFVPKSSDKIYIRYKDDQSFEMVDYDFKGNEFTTKANFGQLIKRPYGSFRIHKNEKDFDLLKSHKYYFYFRDLEDLALGYTHSLKIEAANENGSLLVLELLDSNRQRGMDVLNKLIEVYINETLLYKNELANETIRWIDNRLAMLTEEITGVEKDVEAFKKEHDITNVSSNAQSYVQGHNQYNTQLEDYQSKIDVLNSVQSYIMNQEDGASVPSTLTIEDPTLMSLISRYNELQLNRMSLLRTTTEENPLVVELDKKLYDLKNNILENLKINKQGLEIQQNNVRASSNRYRNQISKVPSMERRLLEINRDQVTKEELYLYLLQKREEEMLSLEAPVTTTRVVDQPIATKYPVKPNKASIYLGALIFGLFVPFSFVFIKDKLNFKIQTTEDIQEITKTPVLGEICHSKDGGNVIVTKEDKSTSIAEMFRLMRYNLKYVAAGHPNKVMLITSSMKGEGKTFFSLNLAVCLANTGKRVVALNFDLRAPKLTQMLSLQGELGILDYLVSENVNVDELLIPVPDINNLYLIGTGPLPPNVGEVMLNKKIGKLIEELKEKFDYIIIDSPPIGKVADAFALNPFVDTTIYMVRQDYTPKAELRTIVDIHDNKKFKRPLIVLNDTKPQAGYQYGYGTKKS